MCCVLVLTSGMTGKFGVPTTSLIFRQWLTPFLVCLQKGLKGRRKTRTSDNVLFLRLNFGVSKLPFFEAACIAAWKPRDFVGLM